MPDFEALNSGRHALVIPENVTDIRELRSLDAEGLRHYAEKPVHPDDPWDSIRKLVRVAFKADQPMTADEAESVVWMTGSQIDEPNIPRSLATLLRTTTDEGVYPERLTSVEGWRLTAMILRLRADSLWPNAARVLVSGMGVDRGILADALGIKGGSIRTEMNRVAASIHRKPSAYQRLADAVAHTMAPLELPELPSQAQQAKHLEWALGRVLLNHKGLVLRRKATVEQQSSLINALCIRYLDRPLIKSHFDDPDRLVSILRQFCSGEGLSAIMRNEQINGWIGKRIKVLLRAFRDSITPTDMQQLEQFVSGKAESLVLERSDPLRVVQQRQKLQERKRRQTQWQKSDRGL